MIEIQLGAVEARFADLIWNNQPISTTELVKLSLQELNWKKSTTYTVLKRLCEKGIFQNNSGSVVALISKDELQAMQSERFVEETFHGSLPAFLAAFTARKALTQEEIGCLRRMIENHRED